MSQIHCRCFSILFFCFLCATIPADAKAELSDFTITPSVSNVSGDVSISGSLSTHYSILTDSAVYSDSQVINSSASGTIQSAIKTDLVFWDSNILTSPDVTLSDSHSMFGFDLALSTTIDAISFQHSGPSDLFTMTPLAATGLNDIGPQNMELYVTLYVSTQVSILGLVIEDNNVQQGPVSLTIYGQIRLDNDGHPQSYYMTCDETLSYPISFTGTGSGASAGLTWSFNGEITITNLGFDLNGIAALSGDFDGDDVPNEVDNCPCEYNPAQLDVNGDGIGDACLFHFFTSDLDRDCDVDAVDLTKMAEEFGSTNLRNGP
jgi:hypothetical protein